MAFPSIKGLPGMGVFKSVRHRAAAIDSLPPAWRPASRLALEDQFVRATMPNLGPRGTRFTIANDPRQGHVEFTPDSGRVLYSTEAGTVALGPTASIPLEQYSHQLALSTFQRLWLQTSMERLGSQSNNEVGVSGSGTGLSFKFPSPLPHRVQSLLGPGGPALNVSGTENIRLSGTSQWSNQNTGLLGAHRSLFPSLDMQQDLDIRLEGQLSDRVKVNLLQNSAIQIPLANRIAINYKGDEDDLIQELDLGNTNLTLPGTQYVSYSGRNEGLFGAKMTTRVGPLDWTVLASKQEGRSERASYSGGSSKQSVGIRDLDYIKGVYFFLYDPNREPTQIIDESSIQLFLDNGSHVNPVGLAPGRAYADPNGDTTDSTLYVNGLFQPLQIGPDLDYRVLTTVYGPDLPIIRLKVPITGEKQVLGVAYRYQLTPGGPFIQVGADSIPGAVGGLQLKMLRVPLDRLPSDPVTAVFDSTAPLYPLRDLELRNFYSLNGARIDPGTFSLFVHWGDQSPPITSNLVNGESVPLIETLGLDNYNEQNGFPGYRNFGHDGKVDGTAATSTARAFVDYEEGVLFFYELRPFAPRLGDAAGPFDKFVNSLLFRRNTLSGAPNQPDAPNPAVYDRRTTYPTDRVYTIDASFTAQRAGGTITLGRTNIVEGSDVVTVNGQTLVRDRDYRIDYDVGQITMIRQLGASDQLNIDYAYAPLFAQAGKTLIGSAFRWDGKDRSFGGAFMYESKGAQDLRPRLGEEPSRVVIGDLNTDWRFRPAWMTRLVDRLPGVRTTAASDFVISAEVGGSMPNPNTKNEVYIDDMEGVKDAVSLSMTSDRWRLSSVPSRRDAFGRIQSVEDPSLDSRRMDAELHWYTPVTAVHEKDLKPNLTQAQGATNTHNALALSLPRRPTTSTSLDTLWAGLTYVLDPVGLDITRSQFIEVWVNDFRDFHNPGAVRGRNVKLHIDLGAVSEDEQRAPNIPPNGVLDSEDQNQDNQLNYAGGEDTGLDKLKNDAEPGPAGKPDLITADEHPDDPSGDDFRRPNVDTGSKDEYEDLDPRKWRRSNGSEDNHEVLPVPDTEDLNLNGVLDLNENYFEYTLELGANSPYLVDSAYAPGRVFQDDKGGLVPEDNGWRRYRIPITDSLRVRFGSPDLSLARTVRVWLDGVMETDPPPLTNTDGRPFLMLGGIDIVGSRWVLTPLDSTLLRRGTTATLNALNTLDNADQYVPPFDPGTTRSGNQALNRREQSMVLEFENLQPADSIETYRTFSLDEDYSRYGALDWYVTGYQIQNYDPATDTLDYFVRFASDERGFNYYEVRSRVPMSATGAIAWDQMRIKLIDLSNLKLDPAFPRTGNIYYSVPGPRPGETWSIRGRPSFTRLRRISFGLIHRGPAALVFPSGQVWFDELRAVDVTRTPDHAQRLTIGGRAANLLNYSFTYNGRGADFQQVGEDRGRGSEQSSLNYNLQADLHRFIERTGVVLPVSYTYADNKVVPRYTAGDDVFREGTAADLSTSHNISKTFSTSYTRGWSERSNPLLLYTIGGVSATYGRTVNENVGPSGADTTIVNSAAVSYSIAPRALVSMKVPLTRATKFYLLPERFFWNYAVTTADSRVWQRLQDSLGTLAPSSRLKGRTAFIDFGASTRPFDFLHHEFTARRNLTLPEPQLEQIGPVNFGRVVTWRQAMDARVALQKMPAWLRPTFAWTSNFQQNNGPELSSDLSVRQIANSQNVSMSYLLPFGDLANRLVRSRPSVQQAVVVADSGRGDSMRTVTPAGPRTPIISLRRLISRLGNIGTEGHFTQTSSHNRITGSPDPLYIIGLTTDPGFNSDSTGGVEPSFGNRSDVTTDYGGSANTQLDTGFGSNIKTRIETSWRKTNGNGVISRTVRYRFPDFQVDYGRLPQILQITRLLRNPTLSTTYSRSQNTDYINRDSPTTISTSSEWRPLIGLEGDLRNGTRATLRIERRNTLREDRIYLNTTSTDRNTDVNFTLARRYSQGQKVKILGKESTIRTNVSLQLSGSYSKRSGETQQVGRSLATGVTKSDRLSVNASGSYGFSNNVTGNLEVGFLQDRNQVLGLVNRSVRVEARAQFQF